MGRLVLCVALLLSPQAWAQTSSPGVTSGQDCIGELLIPHYPRLARNMRLQGIATATVVLERQPNKSIAIDVSGVDAILQVEIKRALTGSRFGACEGNRITLYFDFQLLEQQADQTDRPRYSFIPPNRFVIRGLNPPMELGSKN